MDVSLNWLQKDVMLNARNVIVGWIAILAISVAWSCWTMLRPPDSGGLAADSFGTRWRGHRAILDTLRELNVPTRRSLTPPTASALGHSTLVLWNPSSALVQVEATWLKSVADWVTQGGRIVVAIQDSSLQSDLPMSATNKDHLKGTVSSLTEALGLPDVHVAGETASRSDLANIGRRPFEDLPDLARQMEERVAGSSKTIATVEHPVEATGEWTSTLSSIRQVVLPTGRVSAISGGEAQQTAALWLTDPFGKHCVAAAFRVGRGEVVLVTLPELLSNLCIAQGDNVLLASSLLVSDDRAVVFDEFFHGLSVRGNPMWLFAQRTFGTVALCLLGLAGVWAWRQAVLLGPPLQSRPQNRRTIGEYVEAMSRFLLSPAGHRRFLAEQVRDGVLWSLRKEFQLPPESDDRERLFSAIHRRQPTRANELAQSLRQLDELISSRREVSRTTWEAALKRMTACL